MFESQKKICLLASFSFVKSYSDQFIPLVHLQIKEITFVTDIHANRIVLNINKRTFTN